MCVYIYIIHIVHTYTRIYSYIPIHMRDRGRKSLQVLNCSQTWRLCREKLRLCDIKWETTRHFHFSCHSPFLGIFFPFHLFLSSFFSFRTSAFAFFICFEWMRPSIILCCFLFFSYCWMKQCTREGEIEKSGCAGLSRRLNGPSSTPLFVRESNDASLRLPRNVIFLLTILLFSHIVGVHLVHCRISYKIENIYKFILYIYIERGSSK